MTRRQKRKKVKSSYEKPLPANLAIFAFSMGNKKHESPIRAKHQTSNPLLEILSIIGCGGAV